MTKREFASVIIKLIGLYAIIQALPYVQSLGHVISMLFSERNLLSYQLPGLAGVLISILVAIIVGIVLLKRSDNISRFIIREDKDISTLCPLSAPDFQAIGFSAVAIFIFLDAAVPLFIEFITGLWFITKNYPPEDLYRRSQAIEAMWTKGFSAVAAGALAVILFFRAKGLADFWHRIQIQRYAKIEDTEQKKSV